MNKNKFVLLGFSLLCLAAFLNCGKKGCKDPNALNYNADAKKDGGSCEYKLGCTDLKSINFCGECKIDNGTCSYLKVGDSYGGGTIFYIDSSGIHGLIASNNTQSSAKWGVIMVTFATGVKLGTGKINTSAISAAQGTVESAANICEQLILNGYDDWFLPSLDELSLMRTNRSSANLTGFANDYYWSSSEVDDLSAWFVSFKPTGFPSYYDFKGSMAYVRAIRAF